MKKLLAMLATLTISVTPVSTVVACGSSNKEDEKETTSNIIKINGRDINVEQLLKEIGTPGSFSYLERVFGDQKTALDTFMKYFSEAIYSKTKELKDNKNDYLNDNLAKRLEDDWKDIEEAANKKWDDKIKDIKDDKDAKKAFLKELKDKYGDKGDDVEKYKDQFISNSKLSDDLLTKLNDSLTQWGTTNDTKDLGTALTTFRTKFILEETLGIQFKNNGDWKAQMKELFTKLSDANNDKDGTYKKIIINIFNASGGYSLEEDYIKNLEKDISNMKFVEKWDDIKNASDEFLTRINTIDNDYSNVNTLSNGGLNGKYREISRRLNKKAIEMTDEVKDNNVPGAFSNSERFFANNFYENERPVAVSEVVIGNLYSTDVKDYSKEITNTGYLGKDPVAFENLANFINIFVNDKMSKFSSSTFNANNVNEPAEGTSNYNWDLFLRNGGKLDDQITTGNHWEESFSGKLSVKDHPKLLKYSSSSSDYSELLKYSVYDFLNKENKEEYDFKEDGTTTYRDFAISNVTENGNDQQIAKQLNGWIHSMDRTSTTVTENKDGTTAPQENKVYQVVNAKQGIISFVDKDGIHLVRVEGYGILNSSDKLLREQNSFTKEGNDKKETIALNALKALLNTKENNETDINKTIDEITNYIPYLEGKESTQPGISYNDFNNSFGNEYLRFLANASLPKNLKDNDTEYNSKYSFNIKEEIEDFMSYSSDNKNNETLAVWDYFKDIFGTNSNSKFFDMLFNNNKTFQDQFNLETRSEDDANEIKEVYKQYIGILLKNKYSVFKDNQQRLEKEVYEYNKKVAEDNNSNTSLEDKYKPTQTIDPKQFASGKGDKLLSDKFTSYKKSETSYSYKIVNLNNFDINYLPIKKEAK